MQRLLEYKVVLKLHVRPRKEITNQGCSLSPSLTFTFDNQLREWKNKIKSGIRIRQGQYLNTLLFVDNQILIQDNQDKLQYLIYTLCSTGKMYNLKISTTKTKVMAFKGKFLVRTEIIIDNNRLQQVSHFSYLECDITHTLDKDK
jgi:hypothetical protein